MLVQRKHATAALVNGLGDMFSSLYAIEKEIEHKIRVVDNSKNKLYHPRAAEADTAQH